MPEYRLVQEINLQPGQLHFGGAHECIQTLLGSCVAMVFWHPQRQIGGMSHSLLPSRGCNRPGSALDGHYCDEALEIMLKTIRNLGARPDEFTLRLYGGGDMFPQIVRRDTAHIGRQNVLATKRLISSHGLVCSASHVEGIGHRRLRFSVWDGEVVLVQVPPMAMHAARRTHP